MPQLAVADRAAGCRILQPGGRFPTQRRTFIFMLPFVLCGEERVHSDVRHSAFIDGRRLFTKLCSDACFCFISSLIWESKSLQDKENQYWCTCFSSVQNHTHGL